MYSCTVRDQSKMPRTVRVMSIPSWKRLHIRVVRSDGQGEGAMLPLGEVNRLIDALIQLRDQLREDDDVA